MTRDPICGMTVNPDSALHAERDGETHYFCSDECLRQFLCAQTVTHRAGPCVIVIFGASGDLTKRKLLPSLCNLIASGLLAEDFAIIGVGRREWSDEDFRQQMRSAVSEFATQKDLRSAGYSDYFAKNSIPLKSAGNSVGVARGRLFYTLDTEHGVSGAPVMLAADPPRAVALHAYSEDEQVPEIGEESNSGPLLGPAMIDLINRWNTIS